MCVCVCVCVCVITGDTGTGEGKVTQATTCCTLGQKRMVKSKNIFNILNGYTANWSTKYQATYILMNRKINNRRIVYAVNTHPVIFT